MHTTIDYSHSSTKAFDAIEDIKQWFGIEHFIEIHPMFAAIKSPREFELMANFAGVQGFPVKAWFDYCHGKGSWDKAQPQSENVISLRSQS